ncbi:MAG: hypothetical protein ACE5PV_17135, partial [Candidatus Poribacteria bacterium]
INQVQVMNAESITLEEFLTNDYESYEYVMGNRTDCQNGHRLLLTERHQNTYHQRYPNRRRCRRGISVRRVGDF